MQVSPLPTLKKIPKAHFTIYPEEMFSKETDRNANPYIGEEPEQTK